MWTNVCFNLGLEIRKTQECKKKGNNLVHIWLLNEARKLHPIYKKDIYERYICRCTITVSNQHILRSDFQHCGKNLNAPGTAVGGWCEFVCLQHFSSSRQKKLLGSWLVNHYSIISAKKHFKNASSSHRTFIVTLSSAIKSRFLWEMTGIDHF